MSLLTGTRVSPYEILGLLGAGGMGEVYRARDPRLDREVALKILPETMSVDPDRLSRFEREAKALASLNHPNIVRMKAAGGVTEEINVRTDLRLIPRPLVPGALRNGRLALSVASADSWFWHAATLDLKTGVVSKLSD